MSKQPRFRATARPTAPELIPAFGAHELAAIAALHHTTTPVQRAKFVRLLRDYIAHHGYLPDPNGDYHDLIEAVAKVFHAKDIAHEEKEFERIDAIVERVSGDKPDCAGTVAANRYTPNIIAALHIGIALGAALVYNGGVRR